MYNLEQHKVNGFSPIYKDYIHEDVFSNVKYSSTTSNEAMRQMPCPARSLPMSAPKSLKAADQKLERLRVLMMKRGPNSVSRLRCM